MARIGDFAMNLEPVIFIVDDDLNYAELERIMISSMGFQTQVFGCPIEYLKQFDPNVPGVVLLDIRMPAMNGLSVLELLNSKPLKPSIIIMTNFLDASTAIKAMRSGAADVMSKAAPENELYLALQSALHRDAANRAEYLKKAEIRTRFAKLSSSEHTILEHVLHGEPNKQIASTLGVSRRTIEDRRARVMRKLGVESLAELVQLSMEAGVFETNGAPDASREIAASGVESKLISDGFQASHGNGYLPDIHSKELMIGPPQQPAH